MTTLHEVDVYLDYMVVLLAAQLAAELLILAVIACGWWWCARHANDRLLYHS